MGFVLRIAVASAQIGENAGEIQLAVLDLAEIRGGF